jgi:hypothetical protein
MEMKNFFPMARMYNIFAPFYTGLKELISKQVPNIFVLLFFNIVVIVINIRITAPTILVHGLF